MQLIALLNLPYPICRGVYRYAQVHDRPWRFVRRRYDDAQGLSSLRDMIRRRTASGVIAYFARLSAHPPRPKLAVPLINVSESRGHSQFPSVLLDSVQAGRVAAAHLLERGLRNFAFVGLPDRAFARRRYEGFVQAITAAGHTCGPPVGLDARDGEHAFWAWLSRPEECGRWLASLPRPVGVLAANDDLAERLLDAARALGVRVPEQVAVIGVGNDDLICDGVRPCLTSVIAPWEKVGYTAAEVLARAMAGEPLPETPTLIPPVDVAVRQSTDVLAVDDATVADALRFIRDHATRPIRLADVAAHVTGSQRALQIRFKAVVGRPISYEIRRVRAERARILLSETDWPLPTIAGRCGFGNPKRMRLALRQFAGMTASDLRRRGVKAPTAT